MNQEIGNHYLYLIDRINELRQELNNSAEERHDSLRQMIDELMDEKIKLEKQYLFLARDPSISIEEARQFGSTHPLILYYRPGVIALRIKQQPSKAIELFTAFLRRTDNQRYGNSYKNERHRAMAYLAEGYRRVGDVNKMDQLSNRLLSEEAVDSEALQILEQTKELFMLQHISDNAKSNRKQSGQWYQIISGRQERIWIDHRMVDNLHENGMKNYEVFLDAVSERCWIKNEEVSLTTRRLVLLYYVLRQIFTTSDDLLWKLYGNDDQNSVNTLHAFIHKFNHELLNPRGLRMKSTGNRSGPGVYRIEPVTTSYCLLFDTHIEQKWNDSNLRLYMD